MPFLSVSSDLVTFPDDLPFEQYQITLFGERGHARITCQRLLSQSGTMTSRSREANTLTITPPGHTQISALRLMSTTRQAQDSAVFVGSGAAN